MQNLPVLHTNILLIEDNPGDMLLIEDYLSELSSEITVTEAASYSEAKAYLESHDRNFDLVLLDLKLPDLAGEDLITAVLSLSRQNPVIVLTGYSDMEFSKKSLSLGVSDYLVKDDLDQVSLWKSITYSIERNEASQKIKESEQRYRYLFENNPVSILIWDLETRAIEDSNREAEQQYGFTKSQFRELIIDDIQKGEFAPHISEHEGEFKEGMNVDLQDNGRPQIHKKQNGDTFFADLNAHFFTYQGKPSVLLMITDITDKVEMQEQLLESTIRAEEAERNRIALELHDGIVQQMVACGMFAQTLAKKVEDNDELSAEVGRLYDLLIKTTIETRDISHNLKSAELEQMSLPTLLQQLLHQLTKMSSIQFSFNNHLDYESDYGAKVRTNIYRSVQELCNNIIKHSNATSAVLTIEKVGPCLYLSITDDGDGFSYSGNGSVAKGLGLNNVERRMIRLGGTCDFGNSQGGGFQVNLVVPVNSKTDVN
ncbi:MAG: response regulator [Bacteroidetes bacterium]|jgi:PAS domain S-box-containing protein|nr:response regulator [Bacteroidota bacterium]